MKNAYGRIADYLDSLPMGTITDTSTCESTGVITGSLVWLVPEKAALCNKVKITVNYRVNPSVGGANPVIELLSCTLYNIGRSNEILPLAKMQLHVLGEKFVNNCKARINACHGYDRVIEFYASLLGVGVEHV